MDYWVGAIGFGLFISSIIKLNMQVKGKSWKLIGFSILAGLAITLALVVVIIFMTGKFYMNSEETGAFSWIFIGLASIILVEYYIMQSKKNTKEYLVAKRNFILEIISASICVVIGLIWAIFNLSIWIVISLPVVALIPTFFKTKFKPTHLAEKSGKNKGM